MSDERLELIVDKEDTYLDVDSVFYVNPQRLPLLRCLQDNLFVSCVIKNSPIDNLTSLNFSYILRKLKPNSSCEVIIYQPISVMQEFDAKQVEANAKLAGFTSFETNAVEFVDSKTDKKFKTLSVSFVRPVKNPNEVEVEVTVTKSTKTNPKVVEVKTTKAPVVTTTTTTTTKPVVVSTTTTTTKTTTTKTDTKRKN